MSSPPTTESAVSWPPTTEFAVVNFVRQDVAANVAPLIESGKIDPKRLQLEVIVDTHPDGTSVMERHVLIGWHFQMSALCWNIELHHDVAFQGIEPTNLAVILKGVTVLSGVGDAPEVRRYIDWHYVLAQLGSIPSRAMPTRIHA